MTVVHDRGTWLGWQSRAAALPFGELQQLELELVAYAASLAVWAGDQGAAEREFTVGRSDLCGNCAKGEDQATHVAEPRLADGR
jgi:hypothetical protein